MHRECARELALRLLFIHYYSHPSSYARCEISLPARKRANETRPFSRNATAPRNLARARRRYTCARVCARPRARCSIGLSCVRRDSLAPAYALHRAAYRPARNYAAFAARARYERRRARACVRENVCAQRAVIAFHGRCFEFYISRKRFDGNEISRIYIFFTSFICNTV